MVPGQAGRRREMAGEECSREITRERKGRYNVAEINRPLQSRPANEVKGPGTRAKQRVHG